MIGSQQEEEKDREAKMEMERECTHKYLKHLTNTYCAHCGHRQLLRVKLGNLWSLVGGSAPRGPEGIVMWQLLLFRATNSNLLRSAKFSVVSQRLCVCAGVRGCMRLLGSTLLEDGMVLSDCQKYICLGYATEISLKHVMTI